MRRGGGGGGRGEKRATCLKETGIHEPEERKGNCTTAGVREEGKNRPLPPHSSLSSPQAVVRQVTCRVIARSGACLTKLGSSHGGQTRSLLPTDVFDVSIFKEI